MGGRIGEGTPRMANERLPEQSIPDRSPGHTFVAIARAGWRRHTKESKAGVVAWYSELARRILPRPTPSPAVDKPLASRSLRPRYIFSFRHRPSVYNSARFAGGEPASSLMGGHIFVRMPLARLATLSPRGYAWRAKIDARRTIE